MKTRRQLVSLLLEDEIQDIRYVTKYTCPTCGGKFTGTVSNYCYHCGQKLDWSEEEDEEEEDEEC